tara:strand:- start:919 stop:1596 length:678 start_codon:yes stop_codon:yes gene_type:complete
MLKPSRKILKKEVKKDPFLETFEKIQNGFEENKKTLINVLFFFVAIIVTVSIFINKKNKMDLEARSAFGAALVAYSNLDYDNAKFQFESISSNYEGTESEIFSNYYLGRIAYELGNFDEAELLLDDFLDNTEKAALVCGAIKQLVDIYFNENDFLKSLDIIEKAKKFDINYFSKLELKLLKIKTLIKMNDLKGAKIELGEILNSKNLPPNIEERINELEGLLLVL